MKGKRISWLVPVVMAAVVSIQRAPAPAQQTLTTVPAGSTISVTVSVQPPTSGKVLSYHWRATDGVAVDGPLYHLDPTQRSGPELPLRAGLRLPGRIHGKTHCDLHDRSQRHGPRRGEWDPQPAIPPVLSSPPPMAMVRGWLDVYRPDVLLELVDEFTGKAFGPVTTDDQGQYIFSQPPAWNLSSLSIRWP